MKGRTVPSVPQMPNPSQWAAARARQVLQRAIRQHLESLGYLEVETPLLVPAPGMEPHIQAFERRSCRRAADGPAPLWLHTSPEYAMKRLLADGMGPGLPALPGVPERRGLPHAQPRVHDARALPGADADYRAIMARPRGAGGGLRRARARRRAGAAGGAALDLAAPYERLTVREAFARARGHRPRRVRRRRRPARGRGRTRRCSSPDRPGEAFDDVFFRVMLDASSRGLDSTARASSSTGQRSMAALARRRATTPGGRAVRAVRRAGSSSRTASPSSPTPPSSGAASSRSRPSRVASAGRRYPLDEPFLRGGGADAGRRVASRSASTGCSCSSLGAESIADVLLFPAQAFV